MTCANSGAPKKLVNYLNMFELFVDCSISSSPGLVGGCILDRDLSPKSPYGENGREYISGKRKRKNRYILES